MKSRRRFGVSRFPFRKSKRHEKKTTREDEDDQSIQTESIQTESIQSVVSIHEEEKELKHDEEKELKHDEEKELTQEEELALLTTHAEDPGSDGEECELHIYEDRVDTSGESVLLRAGTRSRIVPPKRKSHRACLILTRYFHSNQSNRPNRTFLDIQSRHIVEALRSVIGKNLYGRRRPLLKITSGELGVYGPANGSEKEERLMQLFSLATRWNAIILLDEADVFMQERSIDNLEGNWLVSTLLRVLEYYEGILFLTTNRVETIDSAFRSRIHLAIAYQPLSADARRQLWSSTIIRANCGQAPEWLSPDMLKTLGEMAVNGREIRNLVRTGLVIARSEGRELESVDLLQGLEAWKQFETDFKEISQELKMKVS
ncbi:hypothetical protein ACMFMG_005527 [Clarireedia jacksonii]